MLERIQLEKCILSDISILSENIVNKSPLSHIKVTKLNADN